MGAAASGSQHVGRRAAVAFFDIGDVDAFVHGRASPAGLRRVLPLVTGRAGVSMPLHPGDLEDVTIRMLPDAELLLSVSGRGAGGVLIEYTTNLALSLQWANASSAQESEEARFGSVRGVFYYDCEQPFARLAAGQMVSHITLRRAVCTLAGERLPEHTMLTCAQWDNDALLWCSGRVVALPTRLSDAVADWRREAAEAGVSYAPFYGLATRGLDPARARALRRAVPADGVCVDLDRDAELLGVGQVCCRRCDDGRPAEPCPCAELRARLRVYARLSSIFIAAETTAQHEAAPGPLARLLVAAGVPVALVQLGADGHAAQVAHGADRPGLGGDGQVAIA